ncbi:hypothetical protein [Rhizobium sp. AC44/96]|uniref:hypothetical protein n=1 Tax=Rhizobium sp. AC44/96 TaxID=1841654 RepID=UPI0018EA1752|nr:hypothetical protein [Rhizobium sp. AC44/96]
MPRHALRLRKSDDLFIQEASIILQVALSSMLLVWSAMSSNGRSQITQITAPFPTLFSN